MKITNVAKARLQAGELAVGVGLRQARTVDIGKAMKTCGYDWLFIDMEHNSMDLDTAVQISVAAQDAGITPIVRVPGYQHFHASRVLDGGAQGIVVPHVDTLEVASEMVSNVKYPPVGKRSVTGALPQLDFAAHPVAEATSLINDSTLLVIMLETREAVANADVIAALPGVDILLVGCNDLCVEMGIPGQVDSPELQAALETVAAACKKHGKFAGLGGVYAPALMERYIGLGMRFILAGNDLSFMMAAARERSELLRSLTL
ncbi:MAG: aldolase [Chromatiales bacterium]|jgi:4-hydroxy-2-oxoheptanedioate aldolase|nr:aldolase [Chromatiales bacterium]